MHGGLDAGNHPINARTKPLKGMASSLASCNEPEM